MSGDGEGLTYLVGAALALVLLAAGLALGAGVLVGLPTGARPAVGLSALAVFLHPSRPGAALHLRPAPAPLAYWACFAGEVLLLVSVGAVLARSIARRRHPSRRRRLAERQRRGLASDGELRRAYPTSDRAGLLVGRTRSGRAIRLPAERSLGAIMAPRSGKSSSAVGHILDAPGAVLATSAKAELAELTGALRHERTGHPTYRYDPLSVCPDVGEVVRWNPIAGCEVAEVAMRRAEALMAGTDTTNVANGGFWKASGTMLLRCVLHAAALEGASVTEARRWVADPTDEDFTEILDRSETAAGWLADASLLSAQAGETLQSIALTTAVGLDCLALPEVAELCSPAPGNAFDATEWLRSAGTLHVVAPDAEAASVAPLTAAFVDEIVLAARREAGRSPGGRLDPPLRLVLDELANIAPLPRIANYLSDGGGRGIQIAWYAQSRHQLIRRFSADGARVMLDATSMLLVSGGLADAELLRDCAALIGEVEERDRTRSWGRNSSGYSEQLRHVPAMDPAAIFALPAFSALALSGGLGATVVEVEPWWKRRDAAEIRRHAKTTTATRGG